MKLAIFVAMAVALGLTNPGVMPAETGYVGLAVVAGSIVVALSAEWWGNNGF